MALSIESQFSKSAKSRGKLKSQRENQKKNQNSKSSKVSFHESKRPKLK